MSQRLYCTLHEVVDDLDRAGVKAWKEANVMDKIKAASAYIDRHLGIFIPLTDTLTLDGNGEVDLFIPPLLAVTELVVDDETITSTQYLLYPLERRWPNGPYTRLAVHPDATEISYWPLERAILEIAGRWGLYEETHTTGAAVGTGGITDSATSLLVTDGGVLSPGMHLLIGSEQLLVEATASPTDSTTDTSEALDTSEEELDVVSAAALNIGEVIRVNFEQMKILDKSGNTLLVARGWNGTARVTHLTAQDVYVYRTYTVQRGVNGTTAAAHNAAAAISRYLPPADVKNLAVQMSALKLKLAETGYSGKAGNLELGEEWFKEFPEAVAKIKNNYRIVTL